MNKEYIERGAVLAKCVPIYGYFSNMISAYDVTNIPAADVAEVKHGRWIIPTKIGYRSFDIPHCSVCDGVPCGVDSNTNYCPNCGAKMDGE